MSKKDKPQVLLKWKEDFYYNSEDDTAGIIFIKKHPTGHLSIEKHSITNAEQHNLNVPQWYFPITEDEVSEYFTQNGREYKYDLKAIKNEFGFIIGQIKD